MPSYLRPGVYTQEVLTSSQTANANGAAIAAFVGISAKGPTQTISSSTVGQPTLVSSWSQFVTQFGGFSPVPSFQATIPNLPYAMFTFFANGGQNAYVVRAVSGSGSVVATRILSDRAGSPQNTLTINAANPGVWGNSVFVDITDGATGRFNLIVHNGDATNATIVERWLDLSMTVTDSRYALNVVNPSADGTLGSQFLRLVDAGSTSVGGTRNPSVQAGSGLTTGADGTSPVNADYIAAIATLDTVDQPLILNIDATDSTNITSATTYASNRGDVFVIVDPKAATQTASQAMSDATSLATTGYAAMYYPRVIIIDPATSAPGVTKAVAPGGAIAGLIQRTDASRGVWKAPAGLGAKLLGAVAVERVLTNPELDSLNTNTSPVNAIRAIPGAGIVSMGARTLTTTTADKYIPNRRTLIYLKSALKQLTQFAIFEPNDANLWSQITLILQQYLMSFWQSGGLSGTTPVQAYFVVCDDTVNTPQTVQSGQVNATVGVALNYPAEYVVLTIGQTASGSSVTEIV